ncbi:hypothetical protein E2I00_002573, partial [Balaenoptera physalus]
IETPNFAPKKGRENARVLLQFLGRTESRFVTSVSKVPSTSDSWGAAHRCSTRCAAPRGSGCAMQADLAKLADKMLRAPRCCRCRNHGFLVPLKGHAGKCRWKQCTCEKCYLITQRQKIMAAQQVLTNQASEEEQEVALCVQGPQLASGAAAAAAPRERAAAAMPSSLRPQLGAKAAGRGCPGRLELRSVNSDHVVGSEYLEREPSKLYRSSSSMQPYHPFLLGYQDASLTPGVPLQQDFRHVSCSHYHGAGLVSPIPDFLRFRLIPVTLAAFTDPQSQEASRCAHSVPGPGHWSEGYSTDLVPCVPLGMHIF